MRIEYEPQADILWVKLTEKSVHSSEFTDAGVIDRDEEAQLVAVEFLNASEGLVLDVLPAGARKEVETYVSANELRPIPLSEWANATIQPQVPA